MSGGLLAIQRSHELACKRLAKASQTKEEPFNPLEINHPDMYSLFVLKYLRKLKYLSIKHLYILDQCPEDISDCISTD